MSGYRSKQKLAEFLGGKVSRSVRAMLSARQLAVETWNEVERVIARGRQSRDANAQDDGGFEGEGVPAEFCQPIGLVSRPAENATVEAIVGHVGADGANPYILGTIDGTRSIVLDARGIDTSARSFAIVYNDTDVVEIRDGKIRAGSLGGSTQPLATKADIDALAAHIDGHVHVEQGPVGPLFTTPPRVGTPASPLPDPSPTAVGTTRFEAE